MMIIDPPITPFSPPAEIEVWLKKLSTYPQDESAVLRATADAQKALAFARSLEASLRRKDQRHAA